MCYWGIFILCLSPTLPTPQHIKSALFHFTWTARKGSSDALQKIKHMVSDGQASQSDYNFAKRELQECKEHSDRCAKGIPGCDYAHRSSLKMDFCISNYRMWEETKSMMKSAKTPCMKLDTALSVRN